MSSPDPRHDPENVRPADSNFAKSAKTLALSKKKGGMVGKLKSMIAEPASKEWFKKYGKK